MMSRDEEMLAQYIREAMPGTLAVVLTGELHSLLRAERERWAAEMAAQQRDARKAIAAAEARGFARAKERAKDVCGVLAGEALAAGNHPVAKVLGDAGARIRAMQDELGDGPDDNRMCECGQPARAHDGQGCFAWEWVVGEDGLATWSPSPCKAFRPRDSTGLSL